MVGFYNELFKHWNVRFRQPSSQSVVDAECIKLEDESGDESDLSKVLGVKGTDKARRKRRFHTQTMTRRKKRFHTQTMPRTFF